MFYRNLQQSLTTSASRDGAEPHLDHSLQFIRMEGINGHPIEIKGLYRVTMGTEVEPNSAMEKYNYFNRLDEAFGFLCPSISREILFHIDNLKTPIEVWVRLESLFGKIDELRGHQLENELISLSPVHFETIQEFFTKFKSLVL